jgi:GntR family phosphonate transport system transcriptional regulator
MDTTDRPRTDGESGARDGESGARWRQIADTIMAELAAGTLKPGDRLATEHALATRFQVNRHTIRRSLSTLADSGFLRIEQGRGSFVAENVLEYALGRRTRFSANVAAQGREPAHRVLRVETVEAAEATLQALGLRRGAKVVAIQSSGLADGITVSTSTSFFPAKRFSTLAALLTETGSITAALAAVGIADYVRRSTRIYARLPTREEAVLLQQPPGRPVLELEAVNDDPDGVAIQHTYAVFAGDRVQLLVEPE